MAVGSFNVTSTKWLCKILTEFNNNVLYYTFYEHFLKLNKGSHNGW